MTGPFIAALFTSATLLFWVQPMVARMLLPLLGGTPTVWNTCMVFFQATLLAGYAYAHFITSRFSVRVQAFIHFTLLLITIAVLPVGLQGAPADPWRSNPFVWLLRALLVMVALPFFTVSASAPLLQSWFSRTRHRSAGDPYFLYAASNLGSLIGLIGYPVLIEPNLTLRGQAKLWMFLYGLLAVLFVASALALWKNRKPTSDQPASATSSPKPGPADEPDEVSWRRRWCWIFWAFVPSSLMLGVTTYLTTDIASVPLLWVIPLSIYLLTFILAFSRRQIISFGLLLRILPPAAVFLLFVVLNNADNLAWLQIGLHLLFFFVAALVWHTRLARDRPSSRRLTEFYFCLSLGGALGGVFNGLLAPLLFHSVVEYRLAIVLACILWPARGETFPAGKRFWRSLVIPLAIGALTAGLAMGVPRMGAGLQWSMLIVFGVPMILCYLVSKQKHVFQFALSLAAVLAASRFYTAFHGQTLHVERNFFGTLRYTLDPQGRFYRLYHGTTVHGMEFVAPEKKGEPLAYYHRSGPCGQALQAFNSRPGGTNIAVIGLGAGSMAAYAQPGQHWTFYEINPAVIRLAQDTNYFTFLHRCTNATVKFELGDARLRLREAPAHQFDLLVCDAFGSDAPPLHLLNREAMELYLSKLSANGVLLLHISSRFLNFRPVIGNLAEHFRLEALVNGEDEIAAEQMQEGKLPSVWVALAQRPEDLGTLQSDPHWHRLPPDPAHRLWTDDYSNILSVFEWQ